MVPRKDLGSRCLSGGDADRDIGNAGRCLPRHAILAGHESFLAVLAADKAGIVIGEKPLRRSGRLVLVRLAGRRRLSARTLAVAKVRSRS